MKTLKIVLICLATVLISCQEKKPPIKQKTTTKIIHYICANKCENSGSDVAGNCPVCKTTYTHNLAYHNNDFLKNGPLNVPKEGLNTSTTNNLNSSSSPVQNAAGVFHYTCTNGCYGGAGSTSKCKSCGVVLTHNKAYHN